ncbi:MAG: sulfotransferase, partial [Proteobacteria bacterium]|nr:sulfotransferase [Pseudomonadota bacterium]
VRRIYDWLGQPLSNRAEAAMSQWLVDNSRDKRAAHRYTLEEFGYTEAHLAEQFALYRERYIVD